MHTARGATLIELLTMLTVALTLLALGHHGLRRLVSDNRQLAAVNGFVAAVQFARAQAHQHMRPVVLCPSADAHSCIADGDRWAAGWIAFIDWPPASDGQPMPEDQRVLVAHAAAGQFVSANRAAFTLRPLQQRSSNGTVVFCARNGATPPKAVIVSYTGRPRVAGVRPDGTALTCD